MYGRVVYEQCERPGFGYRHQTGLSGSREENCLGRPDLVGSWESGGHLFVTGPEEISPDPRKYLETHPRVLKGLK